MRKELLSPAGDFECLKAAIHAGCDAVYIGGKKFGARAFAMNFEEQDLVEAVNYCHLYGVKLYVTVNTMIYENEMKDALNYVGFLYSIGVDAVIVQDIGLIYEIRKWYPNFEIHASTQLHNICQENCQLLEEIGVKRVVLARELTLNEIEHISTSLEKEVFIHGAICISYSGQCLFSSRVMGRSGNRGECAGMCRLPYSLENSCGEVKLKEKYLLSPKELSTINRFQELMESDITCFKIEGRMKSAGYVYFVTKIYRMLMDQYERGEKLRITEEELEQLKILYNREFTEGHIFEQNHFDLMNIESPNHIGVVLGNVVDICKGKIKIRLENDLHQEDGIRFMGNGKGMIVNFLYNEKGMLIREAKRGNFVFLDNKVGLTECCLVRKTSDKLLLDYLKNYPLKKVPISIKCVARLGEVLRLEATDESHTVFVTGDIVERAFKKSTTYEEIVSHLNRFGNTPYIVKDVDISIDDDIFIPMSKLNELRRDVTSKLNEVRLFHKSVESFNNYEVKSVEITKKNVQICCLVRTEEQLKAVLARDVKRVYVTDFSLYNQYKERFSNLYYRQDRIYSKKITDERLLITELSQLAQSSSSFVADYYLNVANSSYLAYLKSKGVKCATVSIEMDVNQVALLARQNNVKMDLEVVVYGRVEMMIMKHCPLSMLKSKSKEFCNVCKDSYSLVDRNHKRYPILTEKCKNLTHLFSSKKEWFTNQELHFLKLSGIDFIRLEFFEESEEEVLNLIEKYQQLLQN